jgi:hypothetical protein
VLRVLFVAVVGWTSLLATVLILTPSLSSAPGCLSKIEVTAGCQVLVDAGNQFVWATQTRPIVLLGAGGYVLIALIGAMVRGRR